MKIIHLISGGDVGGAKTHVLSLLHGLCRTEQVHLVCFMDGLFAQEARELGIETTIMASNNLPKVVASLAETINVGQYQVVHCHGSRANLIGALLRKRIQAPIVTTVHSDYRLDYLGRTFHRLTYGTINTFCLRRIAYHIGVSNAMAELLISRGFDPQTMFSIYNGVEFDIAPPEMDRQAYFDSIGLPVEPDSVVFGIAARLSAVKDVATLIRGFSKAAQQCPTIRLVIAGDGEQADMLKKLAADTCPAGSVCFAGWVSDMNSFYNALDVNTLTSLSETFPYALTEGARQHCATIASRVGGVPDLIEHGVSGLLFPAQDDAALAENMLLLVRDAKLRVELGQRLYDKAKRDFSAEATVSRQIEIYNTIIRRAQRKPGKRDGVFICGAYGKGNAGDDAILEAIIHQMRDIDPDLPLYVLSRTPRLTEIHYRIGAVHTFNVAHFLHTMRKTKLYLNGGGSLIQDATSSRSLQYYLFSIWCAHLMGNKVLMYGCGIGPVQRPTNVKRSAYIINHCVDVITLREKTSKDELRRMGVTKPDVLVTADPALLLTPADPVRVSGWFLTNGLNPDGDYLLFVLRPWRQFEEKMPLFVEAAQRAYDQHGLTPIFLALEPARDLPMSQRTAQQLTCPHHVLSVPDDGSVIVGLMARMRAVVSMRLHALVFATAVGTPVVGAVYDPKVQAFLDYVGQKRYLQFGEISQESLDGAIESALADQNAKDIPIDQLRDLAAQNGAAARKFLEEA